MIRWMSSRQAAEINSFRTGTVYRCHLTPFHLCKGVACANVGEIEFWQNVLTSINTSLYIEYHVY